MAGKKKLTKTTGKSKTPASKPPKARSSKKKTTKAAKKTVNKSTTARKEGKPAKAKAAAKSSPAKVKTLKPKAKPTIVAKPKAAAKPAAARSKVVKTTKAAGKRAAKKPAKKKLLRFATAVLAECETEDLWILYRREATRSPRIAERIDKLRNELIERHYPLVRYIAERLLQTLPKSIELDDLISAGLFGLMDAIRGFDASRGIKFKTYCSTRVRGAILDQLRSQDWVPRLVRLKATKIDRALQKLTAQYGREPTHTELAKSLEMEHEDLVKEIQESRAKTMFSLSEKWEDDDGSVEKVEILEDKTAIDPVREINRSDLMGFITRALTHKERFIIEQYYQFGHTMREIGEMLALTESRVCQIHSNVMGRLKGLLGQKQSALMS